MALDWYPKVISGRVCWTHKVTMSLSFSNSMNPAGFILHNYRIIEGPFLGLILRVGKTRRNRKNLWTYDFKPAILKF